MKLKSKNPCNECPFRKTSSPSPPKIAEAVLAFVHGERAFACHKDFENICVGSLKHANKSCKMYRDPRLKKLQDQVRGGDNSQILNEWEFRAHHGVDRSEEPMPLALGDEREEPMSPGDEDFGSDPNVDSWETIEQDEEIAESFEQEDDDE